MLNNYVVAPDLVVTNINVDASTVQVTIQNTGNAPVMNDFWVDLYVNPNPTPTMANQIWPYLASQGAVWGVTEDIPVGATLTLIIGGDYYSAIKSSLTFPFASGTHIYVQVDAWDDVTNYGTVLESHEIQAGTYNNISDVIVP